jgi:hypothetical protein
MVVNTANYTPETILSTNWDRSYYASISSITMNDGTATMNDSTYLMNDQEVNSSGGVASPATNYTQE